MDSINYAQAYAKVTKGLTEKIRSIFERRFGVRKPAAFGSVDTETLESIGRSMRITRERVRQIEESGFSAVRKHHAALLEEIYRSFEEYFRSHGGFRREESALEDLGGKRQKSYVLFFLTMGSGRFTRVCGKKDHHYFWTLEPMKSEHDVKQSLRALVDGLDAQKKLMPAGELAAFASQSHAIDQASLGSYLEISKKITQDREGKYGLVTWPEVKPRGVRDKAFLVFQKEQKPLHFRKITELIDGLQLGDGKKAHPQTVHNELIKDPRFILVGRGIYALKEWGYLPGTIKDIITQILKDKQQPMAQDEVVKEVLAHKLVAKNTVLINLNNKKLFQRDGRGNYLLRETQTA